MLRVVSLSICLLAAACSSEPNEPPSAPSSVATGGAGGSAGGNGAGGPGGSGGSGGTGGAGGAIVEDPCIDPNGIGVEMIAPAKLSATGLYADIANKTIASYATAYQPVYELWSDGATKARYIYLPDCPIGTANMDHWVFPVGTRVWKEFSVTGTAVETRFIHRYGVGADDWLFAVYQWDGTLMDADLVSTGVQNANGTQHDIPTPTDCLSCHTGLVEKLLGFGAVQLSHALAGETITTLSNAGRMSVPAAAGFAVPGNAVQQAAIGYLHANCGSCHNPALTPSTFFSMRLSVAHTTVDQTDLYIGAVGRTANSPIGPSVTHRVAPGDPQASAVWYRMSVRQLGVQMPPLASEVVDNTGLAAIDAWITSLPP